MQWTMDCVAWMPFWTLVPDDEHNGLNANELGTHLVRPECSDMCYASLTIRCYECVKPRLASALVDDERFSKSLAHINFFQLGSS